LGSRVSTKDKILELLKKEKSLTVAELAKAIGITEMAIRKHLNILERDALLNIHEVRQPMGRPLQVYSLSTNADIFFPQNYEGMAVEFLHDLQDLYGDEIINYLLERRSDRQKNTYLTRMENKSFKEKVEELKNIQVSKGYMAELHTIDDDVYELVEYNCPIFTIAQEYTNACNCETNMFQQVLDTKDVTRLTCKTENGDHCRFLIKNSLHEKRHAAIV